MTVPASSAIETSPSLDPANVSVMDGDDAAASRDLPHPQDVISVAELLTVPGLTIPSYQRPYKWTARNVLQLFSDLATFSKARPASGGETAADRPPFYRLGTVVLHRDEEGKLNLVDGQQRTVTLLLIARELRALWLDEAGASARDEGSLPPELEAVLGRIAAHGLEREFRFGSAISQENLQQNSREIRRMVRRGDFGAERIDFLLNRCQVVVFILDDLAEAFQFFDSQNARGKKLRPHDLLKAYHLREFGDGLPEAKEELVAYWESRKDEELASFLAETWFSIRAWSRGRSAQVFTEEHLSFFKGLSTRPGGPAYAHGQPLRMLHEMSGEGRDGTGGFPYQLDQTILNGRRFFEMVRHYGERLAAQQKLLDRKKPEFPDELDAGARQILTAIATYDGRQRTGDGYARRVFDCLLLYYRDRFGEEQLSQAVRHIFHLAYYVRLGYGRLGMDSVDNYVIGRNLFVALRESLSPEDFLGSPLPVLAEVESTKTEIIEAVFTSWSHPS